MLPVAFHTVHNSILTVMRKIIRNCSTIAFCSPSIFGASPWKGKIQIEESMQDSSNKRGMTAGCDLRGKTELGKLSKPRMAVIAESASASNEDVFGMEQRNTDRAEEKIQGWGYIETCLMGLLPETGYQEQTVGTILYCLADNQFGLVKLLWLSPIYFFIWKMTLGFKGWHKTDLRNMPHCWVSTNVLELHQYAMVEFVRRTWKCAAWAPVWALQLGRVRLLGAAGRPALPG